MFLYSLWCDLPLATRHKIALDFGIEKKGPTEVFSNTIKSDGYLVKDIETALTVEVLQKYIGTQETQLHILWTMLMDKLEGKEVIEKLEPKPKGRPKKK